MKKRGTYKQYSMACGLVWVGALVLVALGYPEKFSTFSLVCAGWWIGWLSCTIARVVYPSPHEQQTT
jgi:hypothetical protein